MAKKVVVQSVCDVCHSGDAAGTFRFGWDLIQYEVDLCPEHGDELVSYMDELVPASRRLGAKAKSINVPTVPLHPRDRASTLEVRTWAKKNGIPVSERGRIPDELFAQYLDAKSAGSRSS